MAFLVDCRDDGEEGVSVALSVPSRSARYRAHECEMRLRSFVLVQAVAAAPAAAAPFAVVVGQNPD